LALISDERLVPDPDVHHKQAEVPSDIHAIFEYHKIFPGYGITYEGLFASRRSVFDLSSSIANRLR
jgi:hypothetical protein